ncbi:universal stress protein [Nocardioides coralli]|uniref:universal stress protein n=1 Tax=Nocardioides coralli TaxID=2872154 RepID=UPI001CA3F67B|nr:universal stress protein [Nocardioides coralli]QZY30369.1 universal stress protein [Nocardioides coralli]
MQSYDIPTGTIAVGVDGSPSAERALSWAVEEARLAGRALTLVHAITPQGGVWVDQAGHDSTLGSGATRTEAQQLLDAAQRAATDRDPTLEVHHLLRVADPRDLLLTVSRQASTVVLGSRGRGHLRSLLLGSVSVAVTRHAHRPVVVVRPHDRGGAREGVLVGVDGTERSLGPLEFAFTQASQRGVPITVLHAVHDALATSVDPYLLDGLEDGIEEHRLLVAESVAGMREKFPDVSVNTVLARGYAGDALTELGDRMDLVVVGAHHGGAASAILLGSAAASVVESAPCPVAVVPVA